MHLQCNINLEAENPMHSSFTFANGYTASVLEEQSHIPELLVQRNGPATLVPAEREFELMVMYNGKPVYDTPLTPDVLRIFTLQALLSTLHDVSKLPPRS